MLDKNALKAIGDLIDKKVMTVLGEFFEQVLAPQFDRINEKLDDHSKKLDSHENHLDTLLRKADKNDDDHDRMFEKLDGIDAHLQNHEKRIKKLETVLQS